MQVHTKQKLFFPSKLKTEASIYKYTQNISQNIQVHREEKRVFASTHKLEAVYASTLKQKQLLQVDTKQKIVFESTHQKEARNMPVYLVFRSMHHKEPSICQYIQYLQVRTKEKLVYASTHKNRISFLSCYVTPVVKSKEEDYLNEVKGVVLLNGVIT